MNVMEYVGIAFKADCSKCFKKFAGKVCHELDFSEAAD